MTPVGLCGNYRESSVSNTDKLYCQEGKNKSKKSLDNKFVQGEKNPNFLLLYF
jgi:hypothetical protein